MSLLQVNNLEKFYGAVPIIRNASFTINQGEKIGLIGRNGCGKTTLLKVLTGEEDYDQGEIHWAQGCTYGFLRQEQQIQPGISIYQELRSSFVEIDALQKRLNLLQTEMNQTNLPGNKLEMLIAEHHQVSEAFAQAGGYQLEGRIQGVLRGLSFPQERWHDPAIVMSGGERTRLALARILLSDYDLLFLDEPTNYLDLSAIEWLEDYLLEYRGAVILISHDRYFLDKVIGGVWELEYCKLIRYKGNYSAYHQQKDSNYQTTLKAYAEQQKMIERQEKFIREAGASEKSKRKAHSVEKRLAQVERIERPTLNLKKIKINFGEHQPSGKKVLEFEGVTKAFGKKVILEQANFRLDYGEKIGLIGANGTGKTTLLKMIMGQEQPDKGWIRLGHEVRPGYFSQLDAGITVEGTPFSQVMAMGDLDNTQARTILGQFLFSGDDVFKNVTDLSGGERRRLGIIRLMLSKSNLLILDEPTNHLDLASIEVVEQALRDFKGTVLMVSHDRYFLSQTVDRYLALINGAIRSFSSYQEYLAARNQLQEQQNKSVILSKSQSQLQREEQKELQRNLKRKQRRLSELEKEISQAETEKERLTELLNEPAVHTDYQQSYSLSQELEALELKLNELYDEWAVLQEEMELCP